MQVLVPLTVRVLVCVLFTQVEYSDHSPTVTDQAPQVGVQVGGVGGGVGGGSGGGGAGVTVEYPAAITPYKKCDIRLTNLL